MEFSRGRQEVTLLPDRDFGYGKKEGEEKVVGDSLVWGKQDKNVRKKLSFHGRSFFANPL